MAARKCHFCNAKFSPIRSDALFCSPKCRVSHSRKRNTRDTDNSEKMILSLCDYSGVWASPYKEAGYTVIQVDLRLGQDIRLAPVNQGVWGILAAPPCTIFSLAGNSAWSAGKRSESDLLEALSIVDACLRQVAISNPRWWALENPRGRLSKYLGKPRWEFQPYQYGDPWSKRTCLWGQFNIPKPNPVEKQFALLDEVKDPYERAITPIGFARAFFEANP